MKLASYLPCGILLLSTICVAAPSCKPKEKHGKSSHTSASEKSESSTIPFDPTHATTLSPDVVLQSLGESKPGSCKDEKAWKKEAQGTTFGEFELAQYFKLFNNVFAADAASDGSHQSTRCESFSGGELIWSTDFRYIINSEENKNKVKSYSNAAIIGHTPVQIKSLKGFSVKWSWSLSAATDDLVADVSLDIFTSLDSKCSGQAGGCAKHEIMLWQAAIKGARPAGSTTGKFITISGDGANFKYEVWKGVVGGIEVVSLIPADADKTQYSHFSADLKQLMTQLADFGVSSEEYIDTVGAGVEPFTGGGTIKSTYSVTLL